VTVIDLGEVTGSSPSPGDDSLGPGLGHRSIRPAALAVLTVFTLLAVTGSVVPEPRGVRQLWSTPVRERDGVTLAGTGAFISRTDDEQTKIIAHGLADGAVRWTRDLSGSVGWVQPAGNGEILLLPVNREVVKLGLGSEEEFTTEFHRQTIAVDARTGVERWRSSGEPHTSAGDTTMLADHTDQGRIRGLRLVRTADGGTIWSKTTPDLDNQTVALRDEQPDRLVLAGPTGDITVFRYADGELVTRAKVPWTTPRPEEGYFNDLTASDGYLVVNQSRPESVDQFVYRLDTMTELWRTSASDGYAFMCGAGRLCLNESSNIVARDLATGAELWKVAGTGSLSPVGADRLLADNGLGNGSPTLIDSGTGRVIDAEATGTTVWNSEPDGHLLLLSPTVRPYGRTMVIRWDLRDGRRRLLGAIESQTAQRCQAVPRYLVCAREGEMQVTAVG
jgi:outer membrane protein assembly factor BamB